MKYIVKVVQMNGGFENEVCFSFGDVEEACSFMSSLYEVASNYEKRTHMELHSFDDVKARQEELLDGITEDVEEAFKEAMLNAEEEEDLESLADDEHNLESDSEVW